MPVRALVLAALALAAPVAAAAQDDSIVVRGDRLDRKSSWRVAETDHAIVYSEGPERELVRIAHNLERLHFLLTILLDRVGQPDDTLKLRVTLIGDTAEFDAMELRNTRSEQGPFARAFRMQRYYDPREDGAVMAGGRGDWVAAIERSQRIDLASLGGYTFNDQTGQIESNFFGPGTTTMTVSAGGNEIAIAAEGRIYAGFAQHYLLTYAPAAYPRWYLDGFGEIFATIRQRPDGTLDYGHMPDGYRRVIEAYGQVPVKDILSGRYLTDQAVRNDWTPFHAWILVHYLFFSEGERHEQLRRYLAAIGRGASFAEAAEAFGNLDRLQAEVTSYDNRGVPFVRVTYPATSVAEPAVQQLTEGQARFLKGRIELGSRIEIPPGPLPGMDAKTARRAAELRDRMIAARDRWLAELRRDTARYPANLEAQLLLAEAECRTGNYDPCIAAADRALAVQPNSSAALAWKGLAMAEQAIAGPAGRREAGLQAARAVIVRANRADTEAVMPLIAYYRSYAEAGAEPSKSATIGMLKAIDSVPASPTSKLRLGAQLAADGQAQAARVMLLPVANGGYDSPEKPRARALLAATSRASDP